MMWNFKQFGPYTAVIDDAGENITYAQLDEVCSELGKAVGGRCLVFSLCENTLGSLAGYCGFINGKVVPIMLSSKLDDSLLNKLYEEYRPQYIWLPDASRQSGLFSGLEAVYKFHDYVLLKTPYDDIPEMFDELALLLTTSGSTGSPKFVRQSYSNIRSNTESIVSYLNLNNAERPITTLPMNYTYGLSVINTHLWVGAAILLTDKSLMEKGFWSFLKDKSATSISGVPYTYEMLKKLRLFRMNLPDLRTMTQAGGKISAELQEEFAKYALDYEKSFIVMYGQCEATARMAYLPPDSAHKKIGSMGVPIPGGRFELIDDDGRVINEPNVSGELVYYGSNVTLGYAESREDLRNGDERGGRLETGDMAYHDDEGFYYISGRKKRFLKIYGNRVNLDETELLLKSQFKDTELAVSGRDDHMVIFVTDDGMSNDMIDFLSAKLGLYKGVFKVQEIDSIPHNEAGKIKYKELEKYIEQ